MKVNSMEKVDFFTRASELIDDATSVNEKINQALCIEFDMPSDKVSRWFKSLFGMTIRDALKQKLLPNREAIEKALLLSGSVLEMQNMLGLKGTSAAWKGLLDREFGYSTYASAKANFILKQKVSHYNPNPDDNLSIVVSQLLGDGSFDKTRRAIRIQHGIKQADYLMWKVALINKAYPNSYPVSNIGRHTHTQGHEYVSWYSGNFSEKTFLKVISMSPDELFNSLTPLGWCLWFLDGGYYKHNITDTKAIHKVEIYIHNTEWRAAAIKQLNMLGFGPNQTPGGSLVFQDLVQIAKFINTFVKPFDHIIPACMKYKYDMKI